VLASPSARSVTHALPVKRVRGHVMRLLLFSCPSTTFMIDLQRVSIFVQADTRKLYMIYI
jgi:hypothetical protein